MKTFSFTLFVLISFATFSQTEKFSIGVNIVPLALNRTAEIPVEFRIDSSKSVVFSLGATVRNKQDYAFCIQCATRPRIQNLDAYSLKINYRKYYKNKRKSQKFYSLGGILGYYKKDYRIEQFYFQKQNDPSIKSDFFVERFIFSPNIQLGRSVRIDNVLNLDFGTQLSTPIKYKGLIEPQHYTPTRGMAMLNFFMIFKFKGG